MRTVAVLPVKRFARAKQRLRGALPDGARQQLAAAMAADVLEVLCGFEAFARVVVVTGEPAVAEQAVSCGAHVVADRDEAAAEAAGLEHAVVDVPALALDVDTPDDLAALRAEGRLGPRTAAALAAATAQS